MSDGGSRRVHLVRHAHAGDRHDWRGDDSQRPLSAKGRRQAEGIAALLRRHPVDGVLSSPSLRCVQTVEPLARARGLPVEEADALLEGSDPAVTLRFLEAFDGNLVACTHGDIVPGVLDLLRSAGADITAPLAWPKASTWILEAPAGGEGFVRASYLPPP